MSFKKFHYKSLKDISDECKSLNIDLPLTQDISSLCDSTKIENKIMHNRIVFQPMEGCDGTKDGKPSDLTIRRYHRFASGGPGLIWFEATAVVPEARANPNQLMISNDNIETFKKLISEIKEISYQKYGFSPILIMQATHSGRYSSPNSKHPLIMCNNPIYEKDSPLDKSHILSDEYLDGLVEKYYEAALFAMEVGFDGIDIKACHRYLLNESLSAKTREGKYGGSYENRTRLIKSIFKKIKPLNIIKTSRMNVFDAIDSRFAFGVSTKDPNTPDFSEPIRLINDLHRDYELNLINISFGNPYFNPHVNRPFDQGAYQPPYHPFISLKTAVDCVKSIKEGCPQLKCISSANSYLREFSPNFAAGLIEKSYADYAGFGRQTFAYPDFPNDIMKKGFIEKRKCCISCSKCTELMRSRSSSGCVVRDSKLYGPIYKVGVLKNPQNVRKMISN